ncbi:hypothetical protein HD554DRAFT_2010598 [Boletus coccyginus]|nr:hypothetical protein HD554DRAFT_2010598 [Boletus coccyginus]
MPNPDSINSDTIPHVDFVLPGWTAPSACHKCLLSLMSAYSHHWNSRNLEHPWYEPWAQILQALVEDLPSLAVAPQSYLWYYHNPRPGDHCIEYPPTQDADDWLEAGNTTLDSIRSIHVGHHRNKYQLVDFTITHKVSRNHWIPISPTAPPAHPQNYQFHLSPTVEYMGIPVLCKLK